MEDGLNHYADTSATGTNIPFTVYTTGSGADFHERVILATFNWDRGLGIPIQMTYTSYHLSSWRNSTWWSSHQGITIKHWLVGYGYNGFWDGTTGPQVLFDDSSGGLGGSTGAFTDPSIDVYDLNYANSKRVVY